MTRWPGKNPRVITLSLVALSLIAGSALIGTSRFKRPEVALTTASRDSRVASASPPQIRPLVRPMFAADSPEGQLVRSLLQTPPVLKPTGAVLAHVLRLHRGEFAADHHLPTVATALDILTDNTAAMKALGKPLLFETRFGIRYEDLSHDPAAMGENHRDYFLATFAELGLPLTTPLKTASGTFTIADLLRDSTANFYISQAELPWTVIAYRIYLAGDKSWTNRDGKHFTFDDLAEALLARPRGTGSCAGTHAIYALSLLLREEGGRRVLSEQPRAKAIIRLRDDVAAAVAAQSPEGYWGLDWPAGRPPRPRLLDNDFWRLLVTGHMLECMEYVPEELQPPPDLYQRAAWWLYARLIKRETVTAARLCPWTHATCGLALLVETSAHETTGSTTAFGDP